jgi:hypothetical protein
VISPVGDEASRLSFRSPKVSISVIAAPSRAAAVEGAVSLEEVGNLSLKGLSQPIPVYNVVK